MNTKKHSLHILFTFLATLAISISAASAVLVFGANVFVWDSTVPVDAPNGIYPVGGSGQLNGEFIVDTVNPVPGQPDSIIQIGLRAQERFAGPTLTRVGNVFYADVGQAPDTHALWNYDWSIDFGSAQSGAAVPLDMRDYVVTLERDIDPSAAVDFATFPSDANSLVNDFRTITLADPVTLWQESFNISFLGVNDPNVPGIYDFRLTVQDQAGAQIAQTSMRVIVGEPPQVGGTLLPIDSTALLLAGVQSSPLWILPLVAAGVGFTIFKIRHQK